MDPNINQLRTLLVALETGTFDQTASRLGITPSAVSQRIRALEEAVGGTLVTRSQPVRATPRGQALLPFARRIDATLTEAEAALSGATAQRTAPVVVSVDILTARTWLPAALLRLGSDDVEIVIDHDGTGAPLRQGDVDVAVTSSADRIQGCTQTPFGQQRYSAVASADFTRRWFPDGVDEAALLQAPYIEAGLPRPRVFASAVMTPRLQLPRYIDAAAFVEAGAGWSVMPSAHPVIDRLTRLQEDAAEATSSWLSYWAADSARLADVIDALGHGSQSVRR